MKSRVNFKGNLIRTSGKAVGDRRLLERGLKPECSSGYILPFPLFFCPKETDILCYRFDWLLGSEICSKFDSSPFWMTYSEMESGCLPIIIHNVST